MSKINTCSIHETWGFDRLYYYLKDGFRVLHEAYKVVIVKRSGNPYERPVHKKQWHLENILTEDLIEIAEDTPKQLDYVWDIDSKDPKKKNKVDISIIYSFKLGFEKRLCIECKRLRNNNSLCREYYVNGIKRFVTGYYSEKIPIAGMIGFIEEGDIIQIVANINRYLPKEAIAQNLQNKKIIKGVDYTYLSVHNRENKLGNIKLYHMMLDYIQLIN